ncbi:MAG: Ig-like domain-containing protein, partial [Gemmiger sp.]
KATLTVTLGNLKAECPITVGAAREALTVGDTRKINLDPMASAGYVFTPEQDGNYYFYEENRDWVTTEVFTADGQWVDGTGDGKVRILNAKAGQTYYITVINDMYREAHTFTFHLEKAAQATGIKLSKTDVADRYVYQGDTLWMTAYMQPVNGYQGQLAWSISDEYEEYVTFEKEQYDPRGDSVCLTIADDAPAGTMTVTCTDTETDLYATQNVHIKSYGTLSLGEDYTVTQDNAEEYDLATFTPAEDGTYVLVTSGHVGAAVFTDNAFIGDIGDFTNTELRLELKAGVRYMVESVNLDDKGDPAGGTYTLCILKDGVNPLSFESDYVSIKQNEPVKLSLDVQPKMLLDRVSFKSSDESIVTVDENGTVTAVGGASGTAYVTASLSLGGRTYTARCRVDVFAEEEISGVQLSTTAPTVELYSTNYTTVTAIPYKQTTSGKSVVRESLTIPVADAAFGDTDKLSEADLALLQECFTLEVLDGRTVQIVPNAEKAKAVFNKTEDAPALKSSYTVNLQLTFGDDSRTTQIVPIKLTLKKTVPTLKTSKHTFNSFLTGDTRPIVLTGGTVAGIRANAAMESNKSNALNSWLNLNEEKGTLSLQSGVTGSKSGNVYLEVDVEGWVVPAKVTVPVSAAYTAPSLKLSATSVSISSTNSNGVALQLLCGKKGQTLEQLNVEDIQVDENETEYTCEGFDPETGSFTLISNNEPNTGKAKSVILWVSFTNTDTEVRLTVKVTPKAPTIAAKPASVKLNCLRNDSALIALTPSSADYQLESLDDLDYSLYMVVNRQNVETDELDVSFEEGALRISTTSDTTLGTTYRLILNAIDNDAKKTTITITTLTEKQSTISASAKVTGSVDLTFPESYAVVQPTFTNYTSGGYELADFEITDSKGIVKQESEGIFRLEEVDGQYRLSVADPNDPPATGTYYLKPLWRLGNGLAPDKTSLIKFTVKRTAVSLKASTTKIILNKDINEQVTVDISCLTKGYAFDTPEVIKTTTGLEYEFADGKLTIQAGEAAYGKTHTIALKARDVKEDKEIKVSVVIPKEGSKIGATLKAKGTIDLVRDTTSVVITPTYTNYSGQGTLTTGLTIKKYAVTDKKYLSGEDVTGSEFSVVKNEDGTFTVTKVAGADIDLKTYRYRAEMTFGGADESLVTTPVVILPLKSNTVKATVSGTPVLYKTDKYSRATFRLNIADATVNAITKVEPSNALYQIEDYGDGEYAVCFDTSKWTSTTKYPTSITLNVFLDGNANAATKVTLKLSLK